MVAVEGDPDNDSQSRGVAIKVKFSRQGRENSCCFFRLFFFIHFVDISIDFQKVSLVPVLFARVLTSFDGLS